MFVGLHKCLFVNVSLYTNTYEVLCPLEGTHSAMHLWVYSTFFFFPDKILTVLLVSVLPVAKPCYLPGKDKGKKVQ